MKILQTIPQMGIGGAERVVLGLVDGLRRTGHVVALAAAPGPLDDDRALIGVPRVAIHERRRSWIGLASTSARVSSAIWRLRPDLIHAHGVRAAVSALVAIRTLRLRTEVPLVVTFHGVVAEEYRVSARFLRSADAVVAVSDEMANTLLAVGLEPSQLSVIRNGVEPAPTYQHRYRDQLWPDADAVVLAVGRLVPQKAYHTLLSAAKLVIAARPQTRFAIAGDGPLRASLEQQASGLGIAGNVEFMGMRRDARALISQSDIVVFSSESEGLSIAALEALAAAVPVVSTPAPGMSDLLHGGAGLLTASHEPTALADCLLELLVDPQRRTAMGIIGSTLVEDRYSMTKMVNKYIELYETVASSSR